MRTLKSWDSGSEINMMSQDYAIKDIAKCEKTTVDQVILIDQQETY